MLMLVLWFIVLLWLVGGISVLSDFAFVLGVALVLGVNDCWGFGTSDSCFRIRVFVF